MIERRLVGMVQHIHNVCTAYPRWIVQACVLKAAGLQLRDAFPSTLLHVFFSTEVNGSSRTGFNTGWLLAYGDAVYAQRAFIHGYRPGSGAAR